MRLSVKEMESSQISLKSQIRNLERLLELSNKQNNMLKEQLKSYDIEDAQISGNNHDSKAKRISILENEISRLLTNIKSLESENINVKYLEDQNLLLMKQINEFNLSGYQKRDFNPETTRVCFMFVILTYRC